MSFLAINGVEIPPPKRGVTPLITTAVNSGRNADGVVVGQRIGRDQYKIDQLECRGSHVISGREFYNSYQTLLCLLRFLTRLGSGSVSRLKCIAEIGQQSLTGLMVMGLRHGIAIVKSI